MKKIICSGALAAGLVLAMPVAAWAASAVLKSPDGAEMGTLSLVQTAGGVKITGDVTGLAPGVHAFHVHAVGKCDAPDFKSAGGHFNPYGSPHGKHGGGPHSGDMDNVTAGDDGKVAFDVINERVTLNSNGKGSLFDADGSAIVIHAGADDYVKPSGDAGSRVACGVIQ